MEVQVLALPMSSRVTLDESLGCSRLGGLCSYRATLRCMVLIAGIFSTSPVLTPGF